MKLRGLRPLFESETLFVHQQSEHLIKIPTVIQRIHYLPNYIVEIVPNLKQTN